MTVNPSYLEDASGFQGKAERLLVPRSGEEVAALLKAAAKERVPVTVAGAGTGVTGGRVALGGWVLSTEKLKKLEIGSGGARTGAGVLLGELQEAAGRTRQFYPPDPTETSASVGGTIATNASGARSFLYGDTRRHIRALQVALMDGSLVELRRGDKIGFSVPALPLPATTKNTAGYRLAPGMDRVDLFIGSEGTLGVVTEAELLLRPQPGSLIAGVVFFPGDAEVIAAVDAWRAIRGVRMLEYFDAGSLRLLSARFDKIPGATGGALLFEQEPGGDEDEEIDRWISRLEESGADVEGSWFAAGEKDRERFRVFRHALPERVNEIVRSNGFLKLGSDYAVPVSENRRMLAVYRERLDAEFPGRYVIFGHIGDAHLHVNILPRSEAEFERGKRLIIEFAREAVRLGGTVSAEHGLGKRKTGLLRIQYSEDEIEVMRAVKRRLDPHWLLGRGNVFEETEAG